jgi:hypothetical protein
MLYLILNSGLNLELFYLGESYHHAVRNHLSLKLVSKEIVSGVSENRAVRTAERIVRLMGGGKTAQGGSPKFITFDFFLLDFPCCL